MPSVSGKQQRFFGAELARIRAGKKPKTTMSETQMTHFARKPKRAKREHSKMNLSHGLMMGSKGY